MFPDNTVLVNFGHLNRVDVFEELVRGRGRWTATVADECAASARVSGLATLSRMPELLGEPLRPESVDEHLAVDRIRIELSRPGARSRRNLGEAETLAIIRSRFLTEAVFATDDGPALEHARRLGVRTCTTSQLLVLAVRSRKLELLEGWNGVVCLRGLPRALPACPPTFFDFAVACGSSAAA
jgi:hypothetical protein